MSKFSECDKTPIIPCRDLNRDFKARTGNGLKQIELGFGDSYRGLKGSTTCISECASSLDFLLSCLLSQIRSNIRVINIKYVEPGIINMAFMAYKDVHVDLFTNSGSSVLSLIASVIYERYMKC